MVSFVEGLPQTMASLAALVVGLISMAADASPGMFAARVVSALVVFWAFGLVIRALLLDAAYVAQSGGPAASGLQSIPPGTPVSAILGDEFTDEA